MTKTTIKNSLSPSQKVVSPSGEGRAKQEFKQDSDINTIIDRMTRGVAPQHHEQYQGQYGEASPVQLHEALNTVKRAESMFADLPSKVRNRFQNNAVAFLEFVQNADNAEEATELGIGLSHEAAAEAAKRALDASKEAEPPEPAQTPDDSGGEAGEGGAS